MTDTPRPDAADPRMGTDQNAGTGPTNPGASDPFGTGASGGMDSGMGGGASYGAGASQGSTYGGTGNYGSNYYGGGAGSRLFDDLARFVTDAAGATQGVRREVEQVIRAQGEAALARMDVVRRDEHEAVAEMAARARVENEALRATIEALAARIEALEARGAPTDRPAEG